MCKHGGALAVNEGVCNCSEDVQMLHAETVGCVADPAAHTPQGVDTESSSTFLKLSLHTDITASFIAPWRG